jgi:farnesyl diphosphate synthase
MPTEHERIEHVLDGVLPPESHAPQRLHRAMRHATLDGGKRLRARLDCSD